LPTDISGALLAGEIPLTIDLADRLASLVGGSVEFWMTRDGQYQADRIRVAADEWAQHLPVKDMTAYGWLATPIHNWRDQIDACLAFFDADDVSSWEQDQRSLLMRTRFRSSKSGRSDGFAAAAWLRQTELELGRLSCAEWDREGFAQLLPELRHLSRVRDPKDFIPRLTAACADVGVAFGVVRAPRGCRISGACRRLPNGTRSVALTGRHRADDQFWFTFFHESAHLLLHDNDALYLDEIDEGSSPEPDSDEAEADSFAGETLVPAEYEESLLQARRSPLELGRIAREIGVSTGVVIGHLQFRGAIGYATKLNGLKHRYKWNGPTLERA
jgi:hypothetical protein